ncbi:hypothetical protein WA026_018219, partial [Henosepilachna vigintioctopunctata]
MEEAIKKADKIKENFEFLTAQGYNVSEFIQKQRGKCTDKLVKKDSKTSQKKNRKVTIPLTRCLKPESNEIQTPKKTVKIATSEPQDTKIATGNKFESLSTEEQMETAEEINKQEEPINQNRKQGNKTFKLFTCSAADKGM